MKSNVFHFSGVLLLASDQETANRLNKLFFERKILKKYHAITKGIPNPSRGTVDEIHCSFIANIKLGFQRTQKDSQQEACNRDLRIEI